MDSAFRAIQSLVVCVGCLYGGWCGFVFDDRPQGAILSASSVYGSADAGVFLVRYVSSSDSG